MCTMLCTLGAVSRWPGKSNFVPKFTRAGDFPARVALRSFYFGLIANGNAGK